MNNNIVILFAGSILYICNNKNYDMRVTDFPQAQNIIL